MPYSNPLINDNRPLVLDTSVLINLYASKYGEQVLTALPNTIIIPTIVISELEHETSKSNGEHKFIQDLLLSGKIKSTALNDKEYEIYRQLVSVSSSLDDGEAATITIAASQNMLPVIDEKKGRSKAQTLCTDQFLCWSLDLFQHPQVVANLGIVNSTDALYLALREGRMRIHEEHCDHVVNIIGTHRALECNSLPGYKTKRQQWHNF